MTKTGPQANGAGSMTKIVRTPTKATGGITADEANAMKAHADLWISRAMRDDDETVEWGDGEALACLAKNAR